MRMNVFDTLLQYKNYTLCLREEIEGFYVEFGTKKRTTNGYNFNERILLKLYKSEMDIFIEVCLKAYLYDKEQKVFINTNTNETISTNEIKHSITGQLLWNFLSKPHRFATNTNKLHINNFERYSALISEIIYKLIFEQIKTYVCGYIAYQVFCCGEHTKQ